MKHYQILFLIAIVLAIASTFCTITGISHVFEANIIAISIITAVLELGKYTTIYTITRRWKEEAYKRFRFILVPLVCFMTILSSAGIFSFYATSYVRSTKPLASYQVELTNIKDKISQSESIIERAKTQQDIINKQTEEVTSRYIALDRLKQSQDIHKQNQIKYEEQSNIIENQLITLNSLRDKEVQITTEMSKIKQESGFISNVASTVGIDLTKDPDGEFKVVLIIILIVLLAMEPLSVFSMVMGQIEYDRYKEESTKSLAKLIWKKVVPNESVNPIDYDVAPVAYASSTDDMEYSNNSSINEYLIKEYPKKFDDIKSLDESINKGYPFDENEAVEVGDKQYEIVEGNPVELNKGFSDNDESINPLFNNDTNGSSLELDKCIEYFGGVQEFNKVARQISEWAKDNLEQDIYDSLGSSFAGIMTLYDMAFKIKNEESSNDTKPNDYLDSTTSESNKPIEEVVNKEYNVDATVNPPRETKTVEK